MALDVDPRVPIALLPVRLETRWFGAVDGSLELRVRVFPDQIHVSPRPVAGAGGEPDPELTEVRATALPSRFAIAGYAGNARRFLQAGEPVPDGVAIGPFGPSPEDLAWQTDFAEAVRIGLGIRVPLDRATATSLTHLIALGVREGVPADAQRDELATLITDHVREAGAVLLPAGTPTSHTEVERAGVLPVATGDAPAEGTDGARLARALGLGPVGLQGVAGAERRTEARARAMNLATWPATWGYFLDQMLGDMVPDTVIDRGRELFGDHVRAGGPFPTLVIGRQPYGILPVTAMAAWKKPDGTEDVVVTTLERLATDWRAAVADLPRLGRTADRLHDLAEVLAASPIGQRWSVRGLVPEEVVRSSPGMFGLSSAGIDAITEALDDLKDAVALAGLGLIGAPNLLDLIFDDDAKRLRLPLVAPPAAPRGEPLAANYLAGLAAPASLQALRDHEVAGADPRTLLYLVLRHATLLAVAAAGDRVRAVSRAARADVLGEAGAGTPVFGRGRLGMPVGRHTLGDALVTGVLDTPATARLAEHRAALATLAEAPVAELERLAAESLDAASHRLDAWFTAVATERLFALRGAAPEGISLGAWGYVTAPPVPASPVPASRPGDDAPAALDPRSRGYLHAPSLDHARTAAVLRAGFLARADVGDADPAAVDLSSGRVREARWLLEGIRGGRTVNELLGYRVERWLTEARQGAAIAPLREQHPLHGVAAGGGLDGVSVHEAWRQVPPGPPLAAIAARLLDLVDATADLLLAEAVHQHVSGSRARARAALEVLSSGAAPPAELEVIRTPVDADHQEWRILLSLPERPTPWASGAAGARALGHPALSAWAGSLLGDPAALRLVGAEGSVSVAELDLGPLDLVALAGEEEGGATALVALARSARGDPGAALAPGPELAAILPAARALRRLLEGARPLEPGDVGAEPGPVEPSGRGGAAREALQTDRAALDDPAAQRRVAALLGAPLGDVAAGRAAIDQLLERAAAATEEAEAMRILTGIPSTGRALVLTRPRALELARASDRTAWLHDLSRLRPSVAALEQLDLASRGASGEPLAMQVWAPSPGVRVVVVGATAEPELHALRLDAWTEALPRAQTTTGVTFHYDAPGSRAPQVVLLAVPPVIGAPWTFEALEAAILQTEALARLRLVPPHRVHGTYLPAIYLAESLEDETVSTDLRGHAFDLLVRD